jgi:hypothetical protein
MSFSFSATTRLNERDNMAKTLPSHNRKNVSATESFGHALIKKKPRPPATDLITITFTQQYVVVVVRRII